jgi:hypothetical protein
LLFIASVGLVTAVAHAKDFTYTKSVPIVSVDNAGKISLSKGVTCEDALRYVSELEPDGKGGWRPQPTRAYSGSLQWGIDTTTPTLITPDFSIHDGSYTAPQR